MNLRLIGHDILKTCLNKFRQAKHYTILVKNTTDISTKEQAVVRVRWVDENLVPHERSLDLYQLINTKSDTLVQMIKKVLICCNLKVSDMRGQCYD